SSLSVTSDNGGPTRGYSLAWRGGIAQRATRISSDTACMAQVASDESPNSTTAIPPARVSVARAVACQACRARRPERRETLQLPPPCLHRSAQPPPQCAAEEFQRDRATD